MLKEIGTFLEYVWVVVFIGFAIYIFLLPFLEGTKSKNDQSAGETMKRIWIPQVIVCGMLLWALNPANPYGYYTLLRWGCCGVFGFLAFQAFARKMQGLTWLLGITALVYNPLFPVYLTRAIWTVTNIATIIIAVASIIYLIKGEKT